MPVETGGARRGRVLVWAARASTVAGIGATCIAALLLIAFRLLSGFVRSPWLAIGALVCVVIVVVALVLSRFARNELEVLGLSVWPERNHFPQYPRMWLMGVWTVLLIAALTAVGIGLSDGVPGWELGPNPARASAESVREGTCLRCSIPVFVTFHAGDRLVTAELAGADGLDSGDTVGLALVYDRNNPTRVMREGDWRDARTGSPLTVTIAGTALLLSLTLGSAIQIRLRRNRYGHLRPGSAISTTELRPRQKGSLWRVTYADGRHADYVDSARLRAALTARKNMTGVHPTD